VAAPVEAQAAGKSGGSGGTVGNPYANYNNPMTQPQILVPKMPESGQTNQQILMALAEGTGGFTIYNTNDLLSGLERIAQEANQFTCSAMCRRQLRRAVATP